MTGARWLPTPAQPATPRHDRLLVRVAGVGCVALGSELLEELVVEAAHLGGRCRGAATRPRDETNRDPPRPAGKHLDDLAAGARSMTRTGTYATAHPRLIDCTWSAMRRESSGPCARPRSPVCPRPRRSSPGSLQRPTPSAATRLRRRSAAGRVPCVSRTWPPERARSQPHSRAPPFSSPVRSMHSPPTTRRLRSRSASRDR